jgi:hypothetical protein
MKIIDNFLTKTYYKNILELLTSDEFEWKYKDNMSTVPDPNSTNFSEYGFSHWFGYKEGGPVSRFSPFINPLLYQIMDVVNCDIILRARADMVTWSKDDYIHSAHTDFPYPNTASVFYINESDGDTIFYNIKPEDAPKDKDLKEYDRVSPKPNRLVIFDGDLLHTGCSPTKHKNRIIINSNYIKKEYEKESQASLAEKTYM